MAYLVTGAMGCIGSWTLYHLVTAGKQAVVFDLSDDRSRLNLLLEPQQQDAITFVNGDITDTAQVAQVVEQHGITHIIHLAGLQVPFCKANPSLGAQVNVVGTVNIFEAVRAFREQVRGYAYASSLAVLGPAEMYPERPVADDVPLHPGTLYGVYKQANEQTARIYWQDWQIGSVGLRPYIVYGVARDQGMTSDIARAVLAAAAGRPFHIRFSGSVTLQYADDAARIFIAAARAGHQGAAVCNLRNDVMEVADFVTLLKSKAPQARITYAQHGD